MAEREDDHLTTATRLLEKRREMAEAEQALSAQKEEFDMKMKSLEQRKEELERKEFQLKESLLKFDKFLKENDSKRARAIKKASEERELKRNKCKEIERLREDTQVILKQREHLQGKVLKHSIYQKYMDKALESAENFTEVREIIDRFDTLVATHTELLEGAQQNQEEVDEQKGALVKYTEEKNNEILSYNNMLATLQTRLDQAQSRFHKWESCWNHIKNTAAKKTLLLGKVKMATHNMYGLILGHQRSDDVEVETAFEQLQKIQQFVLDLSQITADNK